MILGHLFVSSQFKRIMRDSFLFFFSRCYGPPVRVKDFLLLLLIFQSLDLLKLG